ncbi:hypothetical protein TrRE_jg6655, partial [Triparma retinervis]
MGFGDFGTSIDTEVSILTFAILSLLTLTFLTSHYLHTTFPSTRSSLPEAAIAILIGLAAGGAIEGATMIDGLSDKSEDIVVFDPVTFLVIQLPPIIFNSGYHIDRSMFVANLVPISLFAVLGTAMSTLIVAFSLNYVVQNKILTSISMTFPELAAFGALISATDPVSTLAVFQAKKVDLQLFYLVFGESVVNDAVGLVLFDTCSKIVMDDEDFDILFAVLNLFFIFLTSLLLGLFFTILFAITLRKFNFHHNQLVELSLFVMIVYFPYVCAEFCGISGIVTLLFTAMFASRYVTPNLSDQTKEDAESFFRLICHISETSIFLILGLSVIKTIKLAPPHFAFLFWTLLSCLAARAFNVYSLSAAYNFVHRGSSERLFGGEEKKKIEGRGGGEGEKKGEKDGDRQSILDGEVDDSDDDSDDKAHRSSFLGESQESRGSRGSYVFGYGSGQSDSILLNTHHIPTRTQHMVVFSGLRGAVAFCCASNFPDKHEGIRDQIVLITMFVVLISVFLLGSTTDPMLRLLKIETGVDETKYEILLSELKVRFMATFDVLLSRLCLDQGLWDFDYYYRDSTHGWHESLINFVSGGNNSSLISRPEGLEGTNSAGSSIGSNLDSLGVTPEDRIRAIMEYKPEGDPAEGAEVGSGGPKPAAKKKKKRDSGGVQFFSDLVDEGEKRRHRKGSKSADAQRNSLHEPLIPHREDIEEGR